MNTTTFYKIKDIQDYKANNTITVIVKYSTHLEEIVSLANRYKFMAIDCEWVPTGIKNKIALLQLSFQNGKCFLLKHDKVCQGILDILEDPRIIKIGLGILEKIKIVTESKVNGI